MRQSRMSAAAASRAEAEPRELRRREAAELGGGRRCVQAAERRRRGARRSRRSMLARARSPGSAGRATARSSACATLPVRIGRSPRSCRVALAEQRVVREAAQELRVVVVEPEREAHVVDAAVAARPRRRSCRRRAAPLATRSSRSSTREHRRDTMPSVTTRVASLAMPAREPQRVRALRLKLGADGHPAESRDTLRRCCAGSRRGCRMRSRERKLQLFLELSQPGPETTVVDVGVTDAPFGGGSTRQLLRGALPVARADHRRRPHRARPLRRRVPAGAGRSRRRPRAAVRRRRVRSRLLERGRRARRRRPRRAAALRARALPRRAARVRDDAEPVVPARGAHAAPVRRTGCRPARASRDRRSTTCSTRSARRSSRRSFLTASVYSTRGMTLSRSGPA